MRLQMRLCLCSLFVVSLICILCLKLENASWPMALSPSRGNLRFQKRLNDSETSGENIDDAESIFPDSTPTTPLTLKVQSTTTAGVRPSTKPKPTEPPYIGDRYYSEDAPLQTDCPDSIRTRVAKTEFGPSYLPLIPVLQWVKHATAEQYQRLHQYPGASGWGNVDYNTLVSTMSVLNTSANWHMFDNWDHRSNGSQCVRCAVVGNGGILKDSRKGQEIDQHDYVFRTNGAVIQGFEQDVGSRTSLYTFSTNTLRNSMRSYAGAGYRGPPLSDETRYVFLPDHDRDYLLMKAVATHTPVERGPEKSEKPPTYFGQNVTVDKLKMYHPDFIRYIRNRFLRARAMQTKYKDIYRPSTGAIMLMAAVHTCDQVSAYGFMTPDYKNFSDHYYDSQYHPVGFYINHDLKMEMQLWQQLHQAGLITLYMRTGT
ncbi:alpha-N-acetylgalactosaminide alpha-2,6-sialyltransferase 2 [Esox lucius]|nr:alpha-N-acetylgalactosaminide alpha-2,6-sialyltransferase 2 [Esox lucius]XP_019903142.2 alpha-N-acetylgalactosaminide alpha-2,6-sialyltransferase 2 [Esox lucius]